MKKTIRQLCGILLAVNLLLLCVVQVLAIVRLWPQKSALEISEVPTPEPETADASGGTGAVSKIEQELPAELQGNDLSFSCLLTNDTDRTLTLQTWYIQNFDGENAVGEPSGVDFRNTFGDITVAPGQNYLVEDHYPYEDAKFTSREYRFLLTDSAGNSVEELFRFTVDPDPAQANTADSGADAERDLQTLRYNADFAVAVYPGVEWVPARALGDSRYTNAQISAMLRDTPEQKQAEISTLYEAMQLYQIGNFYSSDDNITVSEGGLDWEHHKPGYDAVRTNTGCCASSSDWLNYILAGDYEEVGFLAYFKLYGNGHVFNYIRQDGFYYIVDMTHYRTDWMETPVENGQIQEHDRGDRILGSIHRVKDLQSFVNFLEEASTDDSRPDFIYQYMAENVFAVAMSQNAANEWHFTMEQVPGVEVTVLYDDPDDALTVSFAEGPKNRPDYSEAPDFVF